MTRPDDEFPPLDVTSTLNLGALDEVLEGPETDVVPSRMSGSLPPGMALNAVTGSIAGTTLTAGTYIFTVQATDALGASAQTTLGITLAVEAAVALETMEAIPTLSEYGLMLLALILGGMGMLATRKQTL